LHAPEDATEPVGGADNKIHRLWSDYDKPYNEAAAHELNLLRKRKK
jgi:hypothetical protein